MAIPSTSPYEIMNNLVFQEYHCNVSYPSIHWSDIYPFYFISGRQDVLGWTKIPIPPVSSYLSIHWSEIYASMYLSIYVSNLTIYPFIHS